MYQNEAFEMKNWFFKMYQIQFFGQCARRKESKWKSCVLLVESSKVESSANEAKNFPAFQRDCKSHDETLI